MASNKVTIISAREEPTRFEAGGFYKSGRTGAVYECVVAVGPKFDLERGSFYLVSIEAGTVFGVHDPQEEGDFTRFRGRIEIDTGP